MVLVDSNVLLRSLEPSHPDHDFAVRATLSLRRQQRQPVIVPQCVYEFYVVATRPISVNGLGLEPAAAVADLDDFLGLYRLLRDDNSTLEAWLNLLATHSVRGKTAHDARLVASMLRHGVRQLLTFNVGDFQRYEPQIEVISPRSFASNL